MNIKETVTKVSGLANLHYSEEELDKIEPQFEKILDYIAIIDKIDLEDVEPLHQVVESVNIFREDEAKESLPLSEVLKNAPKKNDNFFKVPKVLD